MDRARDWGVAKLKALGFQNVKVETFTTPAWTRGPVETAEIVGPWPHKLSILQIGGSTATPPGGITAEIAVFKTYQDMLNAPVGSLKGKIAIVTEKMALINGYGPAGPIRRVGAVEAAKRGAVAYMLRSLSSADTRLPHTGTGASGGIPAIALSTPDAELIDRLADRGKPITIKLVTTATFNPNATAYKHLGRDPRHDRRSGHHWRPPRQLGSRHRRRRRRLGHRHHDGGRENGGQRRRQAAPDHPRHDVGFGRAGGLLHGPAGGTP
jgi:hypothetical protein